MGIRQATSFLKSRQFYLEQNIHLNVLILITTNNFPDNRKSITPTKDVLIYNDNFLGFHTYSQLAGPKKDSQFVVSNNKDYEYRFKMG